MRLRIRLCALFMALVITISLGASAFAVPGTNGARSGDYITDEDCTISCIDKATGKKVKVVEFSALGDTEMILNAPDVFGYDLVDQTTKTVVIQPTSTYRYTDFEILDDSWCRVTPCFKLNWCCENMQQHIVVVKKGHDYIIWTRDPLSDTEKRAVYESFKSNVNGMFGAKFENCHFMHANGSTLQGVTVNNCFIEFDDHSKWSMFAVGSYVPGGLEITPKPGVVNDFTFSYTEKAILRLSLGS